jgi:hypothetical protein
MSNAWSRLLRLTLIPLIFARSGGRGTRPASRPPGTQEAPGKCLPPVLKAWGWPRAASAVGSGCPAPSHPTLRLDPGNSNAGCSNPASTSSPGAPWQQGGGWRAGCAAERRQSSPCIRTCDPYLLQPKWLGASRTCYGVSRAIQAAPPNQAILDSRHICWIRNELGWHCPALARQAEGREAAGGRLVAKRG